MQHGSGQPTWPIIGVVFKYKVNSGIGKNHIKEVFTHQYFNFLKFKQKLTLRIERKSECENINKYIITSINNVKLSICNEVYSYNQNCF